jgi:HK97 family phage portal protein
VNIVQKAVIFAASKALGFPIWQGSTQQVPPGGWRALDWQGGYSDLDEVPAFVGCSRVLQSLIGSPPFHVYREDSTGAREKFTDHPVYPLLYKTPNRYQTSLQFRQFLTLSYCTHGNAYALIERIGKRIASINPLMATRMVPKFAGGEFFYEYTWPNTGRPTRYEVEDIIHIKHASRDSFLGTPPVPRKLLERALMTAAYGAAFMRNQGRPGGVVESPKPKPKEPDFIERWRNDWQKLFSGENAGATAYLSDGATYKIISSMPNDAQYVETLKQLDADFCGVFGVPLQLISSQDKAPTYASSEQFSLQFIMYTGAPLAEDFEQEFNKKLFPTEPNVFCKMDLDSLLRGDSKSQAEVYATLVTHGITDRNFPRMKMNLPSVPYANKLTIQANMVDLDKLPDLSASATPNLVQGDIRKALPENHVHVSTPMAEEQMARVVKEITTAAATSKRKHIQLVKAADGTTTGATVTEE